MTKKPYVVGVIIARQGSKGVPGKNLARLEGRPLLQYTIGAALEAKTLDRVILSTDSREMARKGKQWGADVPFLRPRSLAGDRTHTPPVIQHAIRFIEKEEGRPVDIAVTLQPTSPFRRSGHIDAVVTLLLKNADLDSAISVKETHFPPYWMFRTHQKKLLPIFNTGIDYSVKERQQLPRTLQPNGAVYATRRDLLMRRGRIFSAFSKGSTGFVVMDAQSSTDIDHPMDLVVARMLSKERPDLLQKATRRKTRHGA